MPVIATSEIHTRPSDRAFRHRPRNLFRRSAGAGDQAQRPRQAVQLWPCWNRSGPAVHHVRRSRDLGQGARTRPASAAFGGGDLPSAGPRGRSSTARAAASTSLGNMAASAPAGVGGTAYAPGKPDQADVRGGLHVAGRYGGRSRTPFGARAAWACSRSPSSPARPGVHGVEPMILKLVLPKLGGSPAVWNTSMVFFQLALLVGYGYAHLLQRGGVAAPADRHSPSACWPPRRCTLPLRVNGLLGDPPTGLPMRLASSAS